MAYIPALGSVVAFQSDPTKFVGEVSVVSMVPHSVATLQGTNPWIIGNSSVQVISSVAVSGTVYQAAGSIMAVSATVNTGNSSVQVISSVATFGTQSVQVLAGTNPIGSVAALQGTNPWVIGNSSVQVISSVGVAFTGTPIVYQAAGSVMAVSATVNTGNSSVQVVSSVGVALTGTPIVYQLAGSVMAVNATVNTGNSSVQLLAGNAAIGSVTTLQGTNPWVIGNSSVMLTPGINAIGSVAVLQGTNPWVIGNTSVQVISSVAAFVTNISASIATNLQSTNASVISYNTVIRNDTVASVLGVDLTARPMMGDSQGRVIVRPFVPNDATLIEYSSSMVSTSVTLIQASTVGKRSYVTDIVAANSGSVATIIQIKDGNTSLLGTLIAPGGGGTNPIGLNLPWRTGPAQDLTFTPLTAVSVLYMTVRGYQGQ